MIPFPNLEDFEDIYNRIMADPARFNEIIEEKPSRRNSRKAAILQTFLNHMTVENFPATWNIVKDHYDLESRWFFILMARNQHPILLEDDFFQSQLHEMQNLVQAAKAAKDAEPPTP